MHDNDWVPPGAIVANKVEYWAGVGDPTQVQNAILSGHDVNATSDGGYTALHAAVENNHVEIVRLLLTHGADVSLRLITGETPVDLAIHYGHMEIAKLLS